MARYDTKVGQNSTESSIWTNLLNDLEFLSPNVTNNEIGCDVIVETLLNHIAQQVTHYVGGFRNQAICFKLGTQNKVQYVKGKRLQIKYSLVPKVLSS